MINYLDYHGLFGFQHQKKTKKTGFYIQKIHVIIGFSLNSPDFSPSAKLEKSAKSSYNFDDILDFIHHDKPVYTYCDIL